LAILTPEDFRWIEPHLQLVELSRGEVLAEEGEPLPSTYFPHRAVVSIVRKLTDGQVVETATIGREGMVGLDYGDVLPESFGRYIVQISGAALRINRTILRAVALTRPNIQSMLLRYTELLMSLTLQSVACNAVHSVEARASRWLIATCDRVGRDEIPLTHEYLALMLGVQRATVSTTVHGFQARGLIRQGRGSITVVDRLSLEQTACECYGILREKYQKMLPVALGSACPNAVKP
jgi:CRP-like cAMP-binding protein